MERLGLCWVYIVGIGGIAIWTLIHSLHDKNGWS